MNKNLIIVCAAMLMAASLSATSSPAQPRRMTAAEQFVVARQVKAAESNKENMNLRRFIGNPNLVPAHLQNYLQANLHFLAGTSATSIDSDDDDDPELADLAKIEAIGGIPIGSPARCKSPIQERQAAFSQALDLAVRIQKRLTPVSLPSISEE